MTQIWENFVVTGGGSCSCCGGAPAPSCAYECIQSIDAGCVQDTDCATITYPLYATNCITLYENYGTCGCFEEGCGSPCTEFANTIATATVKLILSDLVVSTNYDATVFFRRVDLGTPTANYVWSFTAAATSENTAYTNIPDPTGLGQPGWTVDSCTIVEA